MLKKKTSIFVCVLLSTLSIALISEVLMNSKIKIDSADTLDLFEEKTPKKSAEGDLVWNYTWGGENYDHGYSVWTDETHIYTVGGSDSFMLGRLYHFLICWEKNGMLLWNKSFHNGDGHEMGLDIWGDEDYLYTVGTYFYEVDEFGYDYTNMRVIKWDKDGNHIWNQSWGKSKCNEQGYAIWGDNTSIYTVGKQDFYFLNDNLCLIRWDKNGNELWNYTWNEYDNAVGYDIWGDDSAIYTVGSLQIKGAYETNLVLHKWHKEFGVPYWEKIWNHPMAHSRGAGIWGDATHLYVAADLMLFPNDDIALIKWDKEGNQIYNTTYISKNYIECVERIWGNTAYIYTSGYNYRSSSGSDDTNNASLIQWDKQTGTPRLNRTWGGNADDYGIGVWGEENFVYQIGTTESYGMGYKDLVLLKWEFPLPVNTSISGYSGLSFLSIILLGVAISITYKRLKKAK